MADFKAELDDAVRTLDEHFDELKQAAAQRLGSLYNPADYPATLVGLFGVSWDYPNIEPPDYLIGLSPGPVPAGAGAGSRRGSRRPSSLPSRRFWTSSPGWSPT